MATTRIIPMHVNKGKTIAQCLKARTDYAKNPDKTDGGVLVSSYACDPETVDAEFLLSKQEYRALTGRTQKRDVIAYQLRQSFLPGEITPEEANRLGQELAQRFTKGDHAYIVCTHIDKKHVHNHIIWNSVSLDCDRKFCNFWGSSKAIRRLNDTICIENGYSIVEHPQRHGKSYDQWLGDQKPPTHRERLCMAIDHALEQKPADFDALLMLLHDAGYEVKQGKNPAFRNADQKRFIRLDTLGEGYAKDDLLAILAGRKQHCPRKQVHAPAPEKLNLLIDIQSKLCEGKGVGYARWASIFNLKQMAQTMNYLTEHGLLQYSNLVSKAESATAKYNDLAARIQAAEKRMAEIAVMKTHIINYVKTKDVYAAYRKAGYSKKYLAEHEPDILLHKAAKKAFDEQGMQKLPTIKKLQNEYAELLVQKKRDYAAYRQARDEMRELLKAKANVDRILGGKNRTGNTEKEQAQR